jgi:hypothetical protein
VVGAPNVDFLGNGKLASIERQQVQQKPNQTSHNPLWLQLYSKITQDSGQQAMKSTHSNRAKRTQIQNDGIKKN